MGQAKLKMRSSTSIIVENNVSGREQYTSHSSLAKVLDKYKRAELGAYIVPEKHHDVFHRRILVNRIPKRPDIGDDLPDLQDMQFTDMPWVGYASFNEAYRGFRSKYRLTVVIEIIREIDGYLYRLAVDVPERAPDPLTLKLVEIPPLEKWAAYYTVSVRKDLNDEEMAKHFTDVRQVPESLINEMIALGYVLKDNVFSHPNVTGYEGNIRCDLWGKIVRANNHLREVK